MQRSLARRYAPLAALAAVQLLVIALAPSRAPDDPGFTQFATGPNGAQQFDGTGSGDGTGNDFSTGDGSDFSSDGTGGTGGTAGGGGTTGTGGTTGGGGGGGGTTGGGGGGAVDGGGGGGQPAGDTSHCVDGRQFNPAITFHAPPCTPKFQGDNGGATYQGVSADEVLIIDYVGKGSDAVDTILKAQGAFVELEQRRAYNAAVMDFVNANFELYGRTFRIEIFQGNCDTIPPNNRCLRNEMRQIVKDKKPYFFKWNSSLSSETYDELSRLGTPNAGGWHFRDSFHQVRRPFHWDVQMSGTKVAQHVAEWYCKQLSGPTEYAGTANSLQNFNGQPRVLGVISTNDPENQAMVEVDLRKALGGCGKQIAKTYFYAQDITTADQQRRAAVTRMRDDPTATTVLCLCDLVAPMFLYAEEQQQNYYPENLIGGFGFMDADQAAQAYMGQVACPLKGSRPCNFEDAFGISSITAQEPENKDAGARVWQAAGREGNPPYNSVTGDWDYWNMIASLIQGAGPTLHPGTMEAGAFAQGFRGGGNTGQIRRGFSEGNYTWNQDMRVVYWSTTKPSSRNGVAGTYVQVGGSRIDLGKYPNSSLQIPAKPR
ncbi:MAG TPA: hypothetical protein VMN58_08700 [Acidimicrobiales bacterium]|nr:hypothetical protein [Acidimicrobiales bacterium]